MAIPKVQTYLAQKAVDTLNEQFNLNASIERIRIGFPNRIYVHNAYVPDEHLDTMIYAEEIKVVVTGFNAESKFLRTSEVYLNNGRLYMQKWPEDSAFNFQMFLNRFKPKVPKKRKNRLKWKSADVEIHNMRYIKNRLNCEDSCTNIFIDDSDIKIKDFFLNGPYVSAKFESFTFKDRYRFELEEFHGDLAFQEKYIKAEDLFFKTTRSTFKGDVRLAYRDHHDLAQFVDKVEIISDIEQANMASDEFIQWLPIFPDFGDFQLSARSSGTVNHLQCDEIDLQLGEGSSFFGHLNLDHTTRKEDLTIDAVISYLKTNDKDLKRYVYPLVGRKMPPSIERLGNMEVRGKYKGGIQSLNVDGAITSDLGYLELNANLRNLKSINNIQYNGDIAMRKFDLGYLLDIKGLKRVTLSGGIDGGGVERDHLHFTANVDVDEMQVNNYTFQNLTMKGETEDRLFNGTLNLKDPSLDIDFDGKIDFTQDTALLDFRTSVKKADLFALGLDKDTISVARGDVDIDLKYYDERWFEGYINIFNTDYESPDRFYFFDSIKVASLFRNDEHNIHVSSQILNAELNGDFYMVDLIPAIKHISSNMYHLYEYDLKKELVMNCDFGIDFNNTELLSSLFAPDLTIEPGTKLRGAVVLPQERLNLTLESPGIGFKDHQFNDLNIAIADTLERNRVHAQLGRYTWGDLEVDSTDIVLKVDGDSIDYSIKAEVKDSVNDSHIVLRGYALEKRDQNYLIHIDRASFNLRYDKYMLVGENNILLSEKRVEIRGVRFQGEEGSLDVNGVLSDNDMEILRLRSHNLDLAALNYFHGRKNLELSGTVNGEFMLSGAYGTPKLISDMSLDSLGLNDSWVGNVNLSTDWDLEENKLEYNLNVVRKQLESMRLLGSYYPDSNKTVGARIIFDRFRLDMANPFLVGILQDIRGTMSGEILINGDFLDPKMQGELVLDHVGLNVPFVNGDFNLVGSPVVKVSEKEISLKRTEIRDSREDTKGEVTAIVTHNFFKDVNLDIQVKADRLKAMDLARKQNNLFHGVGYASGNLQVKGPLKDLLLEMNLKTERGTDFKIPIVSPTEIENSEFITYLGSHREFEDLLKDFKKDLGIRGLAVKINVEATPDAQIELIMDETVGDIIRATGAGNLRMEMTPAGEFSMYGDYEIEKGSYLFTMRNLVNKPFTLTSGGTLTWQGDPYEATMDLNAVYDTRASLTGMVTSPDYQDQKVKVELYLILKGLLSNPSIAFDIKLPGSSTAWQSELSNRLTNVDELNQQAFSLLMLNTFWVTNENSSAGGVFEQGITANTSQMLFSQVSNWINSGTDFIDVNMSYSQATNEGFNDEFELELSKGFYDDRITVNGILDVPVGGTSDQANSGTSQSFTGDIEVLYKVTKDGRIQTKFFNRSNQNNPTRDNLAPYTQGLGILYRRDFETWGDFWRFFFGKAKREEEAAPAED